MLSIFCTNITFMKFVDSSTKYPLQNVILRAVIDLTYALHQCSFGSMLSPVDK